MLTRIKGIVLQTIRHNDKNNIIVLYTRERGRVSLLSSAAGGKQGKIRNARLSLMAVVESDVNFKETRELQYLGAINPVISWRNIYFDPMKSALAFFMAEFVNKLLYTSDADPALWDFLVGSLHHLDTLDKGIANFHIAFLIRLLPFMGIEPDITGYSPGAIFDLQAGEYTDDFTRKGVYLSAIDSARVALLLRMNYGNMHLYRFNVEERRNLLNVLIKYYSLHLPIREDLKCMEVLRELFA